jgi:hypothetical protein
MSKLFFRVKVFVVFLELQTIISELKIPSNRLLLSFRTIIPVKMEIKFPMSTKKIAQNNY